MEMGRSASTRRRLERGASRVVDFASREQATHPWQEDEANSAREMPQEHGRNLLKKGRYRAQHGPDSVFDRPAWIYSVMHHDKHGEI